MPTRRAAVAPPELPARLGEADDASNHRNGASGKTVLTEDGPLPIEVPGNGKGSCEPVLIL